jgi:hypothetical protein
MSVVDIRDALVSVFSGVAGIKNVLTYEPTAVHRTPMMYVLWINTRYEMAGQVLPTTYTFLCRLLVAWQDNEQATELALPFVDSVPTALWNELQTNPTLTAALPRGYAQVVESELVFVDAAGGRYIGVDFTAEAVVKPFRSST